MADPLALTKNELSDLLCHSCGKYLSVIPIFLKDGKFYCGRCESSGERVTIYEKLAKRMTFPCANEPCTNSLKLYEVLEHEKEYCRYKVVCCPKPNCLLHYKVDDLYSHFNIDHKELLLVNDSQLKRTLRDLPLRKFNVHKAAHLVRHQGQSYIFMIYGTCKEDSNDPGYIGSYSYSFGVFYLYKDDNTKPNYDLKVSIKHDSGEDPVFNWFNEQIRPYSEEEYCLSCYEFSCSKGHMKNLRKKLWNRIDDYENTAETLVVTISLSLKDEQKPQAHCSLSPESISLASKLECPVCFDLLCAPIYNCNNGHSICSKCKKRLKICAFCQVPVAGISRNYALEEIADSIEICCANATKGCNYVAIVKNTKNHIVNCRYRDNWH